MYIWVFANVHDLLTKASANEDEALIAVMPPFC